MRPRWNAPGLKGRRALLSAGTSCLADQLLVLPPAAAPQDKFRASLPGIEAWQARVVAECRRLGYVEVRRDSGLQGRLSSPACGCVTKQLH
jgi:hypothetical protein